MDYLVLAALIFGVSLMPAFGPPSWIILVSLYVRGHLLMFPAVIIGAVATAAGRMVLALVTRRLRDHLSAPTRLHLEALGKAIRTRRAGVAAGVGVVVVSPVPSAQLWEAVGLLRMPILPLGAAFAAGRIVTYTIYLSAARLAAEPLGDLLTEGFRSPLSLGLNAGLLILLFLMSRIRWLELFGSAVSTDDAVHPVEGVK